MAPFTEGPRVACVGRPLRDSYQRRVASYAPVQESPWDMRECLPTRRTRVAGPLLPAQTAWLAAATAPPAEDEETERHVDGLRLGEGREQGKPPLVAIVECVLRACKEPRRQTD